MHTGLFRYPCNDLHAHTIVHINYAHLHIILHQRASCCAQVYMKVRMCALSQICAHYCAHVHNIVHKIRTCAHMNTNFEHHFTKMRYSKAEKAFGFFSCVAFATLLKMALLFLFS